MKLPKKIAALLTVTLVASSSANLGHADTTKAVSEDKLVGAGRWETAIEVSKKGWTKSDKAVIVNDNAIADALAATPFAEAENAPILLTGKDKLDERTKAELKRLGVKKVYLIGGEAVLSKNIETELKAENLEIDRIQGATRELTALAIADRLDKIKDISEIAVVNGYTGLADAVSIAAVAADKDMAIILSNSTEGTKASDEFINKEDIKTSYVIGGPNSVSNEVLGNLPNAKRINGIDRNETNAKVIETFYTQKELNNAYVAKNGMGKEDQLIDALAVGVLAAKNDSPVIIVGNKLSEMQKDVTNTKSFNTVTQVGGNGNENAFNELKTMQGVTTEEGQYVSSDEFFETAGAATSGKYNVNGEVVVKRGHKFASNANVTYRGGTFDFTEKAEVNANNSNITFENSKIKYAKDQVYTGITHANQLTYINCEIEGQFFAYSPNTKFVNCTFKTNDPENYNIWTYGSNVTFENCKFESAGKSVLVYNEGVDTKVDLKDCTFTASEDTAKKAAIEISGQFSKPTVTIENCTQTGFDTKGLWFVKDSTNKPIVEVDGHKQVNADEFFETAGAATSGKYEVNGDVVVKRGHKFASNANVTYRGGTFDFTEKAEVNANNSNITFENSKIKYAKDQVYTGITHANQLTYINCEIEGQFFAYSPNTKFVNCTFKTNDPENYNIWTYGSNVTFENCKFESAGKSVLVYNEGVDTKVDLKDCTFTASEDTAKKAAIEISGQFSKPTVTIENCTQTGFDTKGLWFVKDSTKEPVVKVDNQVQNY